VGDAGVSDQLYAGRLRRVDHIHVLPDALPYLGAGHQEQSGCAVERLTQRRLVGVVGAAYRNASACEVSQRLDAASGGDDVLS
jgi:nanoRNase/pAp phosphatase (c-di-AMP/oligoRNAs hydrolase)